MYKYLIFEIYIRTRIFCVLFLVKPMNESIDHCHFCWSHAFISFVLEHLTAHLIDVIFIWSKTTHTFIYWMLLPIYIYKMRRCAHIANAHTACHIYSFIATWFSIIENVMFYCLKTMYMTYGDMHHFVHAFRFLMCLCPRIICNHNKLLTTILTMGITQ